MRRFSALFTLLMLSGVLAFAQTRVVSGKVIDKDGNPVPFASIKIQNTNTGVSADVGGAYNIKVKNESVLAISATGYSETIVPVGSENSFVTVLKPSTAKNVLTEIVVTGAFNQKKQKRELGTSTTVLNNSEITASGGQNIAASLNGKVSGLEVRQVNTGVTGDTRIVLRGNRSLLGDNQALLVVDGTVMPTDFLNSLSPSDISSVNVLKGAGAAAIYGNEASNGVLIITTNHGSRSSKPVITLNSKVNFESVQTMPDLQNIFGSYGGEDFFDQYGNPKYVPYENQAFGPRYDGSIVPLGAPVRVFYPDFSFKDIVNYVKYSALPNEKKNFFNQAVTTENDISISNGDARGSYYLSLSDVRQTGVVPNDESKRNSLKLNANREITDKLSTDFSFNFSKRTYEIAGPDFFQYPFRSVYWLLINQPAHAPITSFKDIVNNPFATPSGYANAYYGNPYWPTVNSRNNNIKNEFFGNFALKYKLNKYINAQYLVSYTGRFENVEDFAKGVKFEPWASIPAKNDFTIDGITYPASGSNPGTLGNVFPTGYRQSYIKTRLQGDFLLTGQKDILRNLNAKLVLGNSVYQIDIKDNNTGRDANGTYNNYSDVGVWGPAYAIGNPLSYYSQSRQRAIGFFGDLTLGFKNYLFLNGTYRVDADSRLESKNRIFHYPSANLAFVFTDAIKALNNNKFINYGKFRVSYAKVGKITVGPYNTRNTYGPPVGLPLGDVSGYSSGDQFNNPNIQPEITTEYEAGLEMVLFDKRVSLDAAVVRSITNNQTLPVSISAAAGRSLALQNVGEVEANTIELSLNVSVIRKRNFDWKLGANYTYLKNTVNSVAPGITDLNLGNNIYAVQGLPFPIIKVTDWNRDPSGRIIVDKNTGLPSRNAALKNFGQTEAPHRLSMNTSVRFKAITLSASAEYRHGANIYNSIGNPLDFTGISTNTTRFNRVAFVVPNSVYEDGAGTGKYVTNTSSVISQNQWTFWSNTYNNVGSNYITSADFLKIREVVLSFELPKDLFKNSRFLKAGSFNIFARDLFMFRPSENIYTDPEFSNSTGNGVGNTDINQTPTTRKIGVGFNLVF